MIDNSLRNKIEAMLFASSDPISVEDIAKAVKIKPELVSSIVEEINKLYTGRDAPIYIKNDNYKFKFHVKDFYLPFVKKIVTSLELPKSLMETLAVIAWKYPISQADLIKLRTNKAYDHLTSLEEAGFILREKYGRTKKIKLSSKFFDYFDLPEGKDKNAIRNLVSGKSKDRIIQVEKSIEEMEKKIDELESKKENEIKGQQTLLTEDGTKLNVYKENNVEINISEKSQSLESYDEPVIELSENKNKNTDILEKALEEGKILIEDSFSIDSESKTVKEKKDEN